MPELLGRFEPAFLADGIEGAYPVQDGMTLDDTERTLIGLALARSEGNVTQAAKILSISRDTLRYRIGRIEQLTGRDLSRLEDRLDFFLALRLS